MCLGLQLITRTWGQLELYIASESNDNAAFEFSICTCSCDYLTLTLELTLNCWITLYFVQYPTTSRRTSYQIDLIPACWWLPSRPGYHLMMLMASNWGMTMRIGVPDCYGMATIWGDWSPWATGSSRWAITLLRCVVKGEFLIQNFRFQPIFSLCFCSNMWNMCRNLRHVVHPTTVQ